MEMVLALKGYAEESQGVLVEQFSLTLNDAQVIKHDVADSEEHYLYLMPARLYAVLRCELLE